MNTQEPRKSQATAPASTTDRVDYAPPRSIRPVGRGRHVNLMHEIPAGRFAAERVRITRLAIGRVAISSRS